MFTTHAPNNSNFFELTTDIFQKCSQFMLQIIQFFLINNRHFSKMFTIHARNNSNFFELTTDNFQNFQNSGSE